MLVLHLHYIDDDANAPIVNFFAVALSLDNLRRDIIWRPTCCVQKLCPCLIPVALDECRQPKVRDLQIPIVVDEEVLWLQISVRHTLGVTVGDSIDELVKVHTGLCLFEVALLHNLVKELSPGHKLEDNKYFRFRRKDLGGRRKFLKFGE